MKVKGIVTDKNNNVVDDAIIEIKDDNFKTLYSTKSDSNGYYELDCESNIYPFLIGVKNYAIENLEFSCHNLDLNADQTKEYCGLSINEIYK